MGQLDPEGSSLFKSDDFIQSHIGLHFLIPFMITKLQSLPGISCLRVTHVQFSVDIAGNCLPYGWKHTLALCWLATSHRNDSVFLSGFNCKTVGNCPSWWYRKVLMARWGISPPLGATVVVIMRLWPLSSAEWSTPYYKMVLFGLSLMWHLIGSV